jgi:hypothetical protein
MVAYCSTPRVLTLTVGSTTLDLMDQNNGFRIQELDIGFPNVREDMDNRADQSGMYDYTRLFADRAVTITGSIVPSVSGSRQKSLHALAPFLNPNARALLTWQIDGDVTPRTLTVRVAQLTAPFNDPQVTAFQLGFKAADPTVYDANVQTAIVTPGGPGSTGRVYPLTFNRTYPPYAGSFAVTHNNGDVNVSPLLRFYGPITGAQLNWIALLPTGNISYPFSFLSGFIINAGTYVEVDCHMRTALLNGQPGNSVYSSIYTFGLMWPYIPAGSQTSWSLQGSNLSNVTQTQIIWQDAYLL